MKTIEEIKADLTAKTGAEIAVEGNSLVIPKEKIQAVCSYLKENPDYRMDYLANLCATDFKEHLEVAYHIYSMAKKEGSLCLKTRTDREQALVPTVTNIWRGAEYQEREAYALVGVKFEGHPDLRRILMWDEFQHHPLRKDYVEDDQDLEVS